MRSSSISSGISTSFSGSKPKNASSNAGQRASTSAWRNPARKIRRVSVDRYQASLRSVRVPVSATVGIIACTALCPPLRRQAVSRICSNFIISLMSPDDRRGARLAGDCPHMGDARRGTACDDDCSRVQRSEETMKAIYAALLFATSQLAFADYYSSVDEDTCWDGKTRSGGSCMVVHDTEWSEYTKGRFIVKYKNVCDHRIYASFCNERNNGSEDCGASGIMPGSIKSWATGDANGRYSY